jgi:hemoglobin
LAGLTASRVSWAFNTSSKVHHHLKITEEKRQRFVALSMEALDEAGLPADEPFREAVRMG